MPNSLVIVIEVRRGNKDLVSSENRCELFQHASKSLLRQGRETEK